MVNWKKLAPGTFMTEFGQRLDDGRWLCVIEGPNRPPKQVFCTLTNGVWFDDAIGGGTAIPAALAVTHIGFVPELPAVS